MMKRTQQKFSEQNEALHRLHIFVCLSQEDLTHFIHLIN